jgi:hypothetical protein
VLREAAALPRLSETSSVRQRVGGDMVAASHQNRPRLLRIAGCCL